MIKTENERTGEVREYTCEFRVLKILALANVECLMHIALADPDEHIEAMGGEDKLRFGRGLFWQEIETARIITGGGPCLKKTTRVS